VKQEDISTRKGPGEENNFANAYRTQARKTATSGWDSSGSTNHPSYFESPIGSDMNVIRRASNSVSPFIDDDRRVLQPDGNAGGQRWCSHDSGNVR
jgi:hypothetical protein